MEELSLNNQFLLQAFSNLSHGTHMQSFPAALMANAAFLNRQNIDELIQIEMKRIKENWSYSEEQFTEQMLVENPIQIERRTNNNNHQKQGPISEDELINVVSVTPDTTNDINPSLQQQQQRADACRRSRYNNKIKKAKTKYRHKFMSQKLLQSTQLFDCIQDLIAKAEKHLLSQGCSQDKLQYLRHSLNVDTAIDSIRNLEHTMKMEN